MTTQPEHTEAERSVASIEAQIVEQEGEYRSFQKRHWEF